MVPRDATPQHEPLGQRHQAILRGVVLEFVATGEPVGSKHLKEELDVDVSSATIRNDMAALEEQGLIYQPFTSAGRIPTDLGFRTFVDQLMGAAKLSRDIETNLRRRVTAAESADDTLTRAEELARCLGVLVKDLAFVASPRSGRTALAGLPALLQAPEAKQDIGWVAELMDFIEDPDGFNAHLANAEMTLDAKEPVRFVIGRENTAAPLQRCTLVLTRTVDARSHEPRLIGFVGPTRLDYSHTASVLRSLADFLES